MCTTKTFTLVHPDGYHEQVEEPVYCTAAHYGQPCANPLPFQPSPQMVGYHDGSAPYLPPTPQYSTSPSTPASHRSGDESDRSRGSSSNSSKKRSSGIYYNGQKVLPLSRKDRRERIVVVENPPTPRTPPQMWNAPHTAPASPNGNTYVIETSPRDSSRRQPLIVDERNRDRHVQIEIVDNNSKRHRSRSHSRQTSTSSRSDEDEKRRRRDKKREEEEIREQVIRARIAKANAEINSRPAVPMAPAPKRASTYKRPAVEVRDAHADLVDAVRRMDLREERAREKEDEAQRQRLKERMMPNRRASVGPGSRRHRVLYDDGLYRYE